MTVVTKNFAAVQLPVRDLEKSVSWYRDILGLTFTFEFRPGDNEAWLNVGGVGLGLIRSQEIPKLEFTDMQGTTQPILQFQVENIHDVYNELQHKGVQVSEMIYKKEGGYSFTFRDPDGHIASLWGGWPTAEEQRDHQ
jgi:catechol 2,3-dioxygenase-like lactoylglutathione lyase family enzyme